MLLVAVDAYSKWLEVRPMTNIQSSLLIQELRNLFGTFGVPRKVVSDNGTSLVSAETEQFFKNNGIRHVTSAPYHPATNGQAERMVYETKQALSKDKTGSLPCRLARFLLKQHTTMSLTTGKTPAMLMFGRELSTAITRLQPQKFERDEEMSQPATSPRNISIGQDVLIRNFTGTSLWMRGTVTSNLGSRSWIVKTNQGTVRRHEDHIRILLQESTGHDTEVSSATGAPQSLPAQWTIPITEEPLIRQDEADPDAQPDVHPDTHMVPPPASSRPQRQRRFPQRYGDHL